MTLEQALESIRQIIWEEVKDEILSVLHEVVGDAIAIERETCAKVAEARGSDHDPELGDWIAAAIRARKP